MDDCDFIKILERSKLWATSVYVLILIPYEEFTQYASQVVH